MQQMNRNVQRIRELRDQICSSTQLHARLFLTSSSGLNKEKEVVFGVLFRAYTGHADLCNISDDKKIHESDHYEYTLFQL